MHQLPLMSPLRRSSARRAIAAASGFRLHGRTRHRSVGTEHAAVARLRLQLCATAGANIEKLTGIGRHDLRLRKGAVWTGDDRLKRHEERLSAADSIAPWQLAVAVDSHRLWRPHNEARRIIQDFAAWQSPLLSCRCSSVIKCLCIQDLADCSFAGPSGQIA